MSSKYSQYAPLSAGKSLPNLISSLGDIEKGRSGIPQPSNTRGLQENEDTMSLAKTLSVCSTSPSLANVSANKSHKSQTPPVQKSRLSSLYASMNMNEIETADSVASNSQASSDNSYVMMQQQAQQDMQASLFGTAILVGEREIQGTYSYPKQKPLSDLDLPSHIQDFKQHYIQTAESRLKLPVLTQLSPRTRKRISLLPKSTIQEQEKIAEYSLIGLKKAPKRKTTAVFSRQESAIDFHKLNNPPPKAKIVKNDILFKQLGKVIQKQKNLQHRQNKELLGKHPAPVLLSDQVTALGKLHDEANKESEHLLVSDATKVSNKYVHTT